MNLDENNQATSYYKMLFEQFKEFVYFVIVLNTPSVILNYASYCVIYVIFTFVYCIYNLTDFIYIH